MRGELGIKHLSRVVHLFSCHIHDASLPLAIQITSVRLLLNRVPSRGHWLRVRLQGVRDNSLGIGARVALLRPGAAPSWRRAHGDGSYLTSSDVRVHFGLGASTDTGRLLVRWPSGATETWSDLPADRTTTLRQGTGTPWSGPLP